MFYFSKATNRIYQFQQGDHFYVVDLDRGQVIEVSQCVWNILKCCSSFTTPDLTQQFGSFYNVDQLQDALKELENLENEGLLFRTSEEKACVFKTSNRAKIFVIPSIDILAFDVNLLDQGTKMAFHHLLKHLARSLDVHISSHALTKVDEGFYQVPLTSQDVFNSPWKLEEEGYLGITTVHLYRYPDLLFLYRINLPILLQIYAPRGHGGDEMNSIFRHYAAMRPFDAFTVPSQFVIDFYSQFMLDTDCFFVLPLGVDTELFRPMDKRKAQQRIAKNIGDPRLFQKPVVGYLSRIQPEKGASIFLKAAQRIPEALFLIGGRTLGRYKQHCLPSNVIYVGFLTREELPFLYNAFDIYCFPTLSGEETFGLTLLEAMACGVPTVIPNWDGMPEVMGDAGIAVEANTFSNDVGSFAASVSPESLANGIRKLLNNEELRLELGKRARERALNFSWEATAKRVVSIFEELHRRKRFYQQNPYWTRFVPKLNAARGNVQPEAALLNVTDQLENPLMRSGYVQTLKEGIALSLLRRHTPHEVEAVLWHLCKDRQEVQWILERVLGYIESVI